MSPIMRITRVVAFLFLSSLAIAQTTATITAHLADPGSTAVSSRTFVRSELKNTGGQQCKIGGVALVSPYVKDFTPNATGDLSFSIYKTSVITCGSSTGNAQWAFTIWRDGKPQPSCFLQVSVDTNLNSASCLNSTSTPVTVQPTDAIYARVDASNAGFTGTVTAPAITATGALTGGSATIGRLQNDCRIDGAHYATIEAAQADVINCRSAVIPSGFSESFAGGVLNITRNAFPLIFDGCGTALTGQIVSGGTVNSVFIINAFGFSGNATASCVTLTYTGTGSAISIGDSSTASGDFYMRGINILTSGNGSSCLKLNNVAEGEIAGSKCSNSAGTSPIGIITNGTGLFTGIVKFDNVDLVMRGTNSVGYQFQNLTTHTQILGGNVDLDAGASAKCFDVQGASTNSIELIYPNANTCFTALTVESSATQVGAVNGFLRIDSGVTVCANFATGTQGNRIEVINSRCLGAAVVDNGSNNSVYTAFDWFPNSRLWKLAAGTGGGGFSITDVSDGSAMIGKGVGGSTQLNSSAGATTNINPNTGSGLQLFGSVGFFPSAVNTIGLGTTALPWKNLIIGAAATNNITLTGTATAGRTQTFQDATGTVGLTTGSMVYQWFCTGTAVASNTVILNNTTAIACTNTSSTNPTNINPTAGTIANLGVVCGTGGVNASSGVVTIKSGGSPTTLTCTLGTGTSCSDTTHTAAISARGNLQVSITTQAVETLANCAVVVQQQ